MKTVEASAKIYDADEIIAAMQFLLDRDKNYSDVKLWGTHPVLAAQRTERIAFEQEQAAALAAFEAEQEPLDDSYPFFVLRENFTIQQIAEKNAFLHRQSLAYLGLNEDANIHEESARRQAIGLAHLAITVKNTLHRFIEELRAGKAGDWEYASIIKDLIAEPPVINFGILASNIPLKQYIAQRVLAETGLTREEAVSLLHAQQALSDQTRVDKAKERFEETLAQYKPKEE